MSTIYIAEEWDCVSSALNWQLARTSAKKKNTYAMVLKNLSDTKTKDVHVLTPDVIPSLKGLDIGEPTKEWLKLPQTYFSQMSKVRNVESIVGYFPSTHDAAFALRETYFQNAKVNIMYNSISDYRKEAADAAKKADDIYCVGQPIFDDLSNILRGENIEPKQFVPKPDDAYFSVDIDVGRGSILKKEILTLTAGSEIDNNFNKTLSSAMCDVATKTRQTGRERLSWQLQTRRGFDHKDVTKGLTDHLKCENISPTVRSLPKSQDEHIRMLQQSFLSIIPPDGSDGFQGTEPMAAGLPVLAPDGSSSASLIKDLVPEYEKLLIYDSRSADDLSAKILRFVKKPKLAAKVAKELQKKYKNSKSIKKLEDDFHLSLKIKEMKIQTKEFPLFHETTVRSRFNESYTTKQEEYPQQSETKRRSEFKQSPKIERDGMLTNRSPQPYSLSSDEIVQDGNISQHISSHNSTMYNQTARNMPCRSKFQGTTLTRDLSSHNYAMNNTTTRNTSSYSQPQCTTMDQDLSRNTSSYSQLECTTMDQDLSRNTSSYSQLQCSIPNYLMNSTTTGCASFQSQLQYRMVDCASHLDYGALACIPCPRSRPPPSSQLLNLVTNQTVIDCLPSVCGAVLGGICFSPSTSGSSSSLPAIAAQSALPFFNSTNIN